jgi:hypothetical protein
MYKGANRFMQGQRSTGPSGPTGTRALRRVPQISARQKAKNIEIALAAMWARDKERDEQRGATVDPPPKKPEPKRATRSPRSNPAQPPPVQKQVAKAKAAVPITEPPLPTQPVQPPAPPNNADIAHMTLPDLWREKAHMYEWAAGRTEWTNGELVNWMQRWDALKAREASLDRQRASDGAP